MSKISNFKNLLFEQRLFKRRLVAATVLVVALSLLLIARLAYLQIFQHSRYVTLSKQNYLTLLPIEPNRGLIYGRNGVLLVKNEPVFSLDIMPYQVKDLDKTLP